MDRGVLASIIASALFATIFLILGFLGGIGPDEVYGWRIVLTLLILVPVYALVPGRRTEMTGAARSHQGATRLLVYSTIASSLVGVQLRCSCTRR